MVHSRVIPMPHLWRKYILTILTLAISSQNIIAAPGNFIHQIENPYPFADDRFGWTLATTGDGRLMVGNSQRALSGHGEAVHLLRGSAGHLEQSILNPFHAEQPFTRFGAAIAELPNGDFLIGAPYFDDIGQEEGRVHHFDSTGAWVRTIQPLALSTRERFGSSIAVFPDNSFAVGSGPGGLDAVYYFRSVNDTEPLEILNPESSISNDDAFGVTLAAMDGGILAIAAHSAEESAGRVYLFNTSDGGLIHTLDNPNPTAFGFFGTSLAVDERNRLFIGGYNSDEISVVDGSSGSLLGVLEAPASAERQIVNFGNTLAVSGDTLLVGAPAVETNAAYLSKAFIYNLAEWDNTGSAQGPTLVAIIENPAQVSGFAQEVEILANGTLMIAAPLDFSRVGAIYAYEGLAGETTGGGTNPPVLDLRNWVRTDFGLIQNHADDFLGLGTNRPVNKLHLAGVDNYIRLTDPEDATLGTRIGLNGFELMIDNQERSDIVFRTDFTEVMRLRFNGDVGIGTKYPSNDQGWGRVLDVHAPISSKIIATTATDNVRVGLFAHGPNWNGPRAGRLGTESNHDLLLMAGHGRDQVIIKQEGNVGIGVSDPQSQLHLAGTARLDALASTEEFSMVVADRHGELSIQPLPAGGLSKKGDATRVTQLEAENGTLREEIRRLESRLERLERLEHILMPLGYGKEIQK